MCKLRWLFAFRFALCILCKVFVVSLGEVELLVLAVDAQIVIKSMVCVSGTAKRDRTRHILEVRNVVTLVTEKGAEYYGHALAFAHCYLSALALGAPHRATLPSFLFSSLSFLCVGLFSEA